MLGSAGAGCARHACKGRQPFNHAPRPGAPLPCPADDNAPPARKTLWLGLFYCCIPTGYALGYIFGGLVGGSLGWRAAFLLEAAAMAPFVVFCLRAPPIALRGGGSASSSQQGGSQQGSELGAPGSARRPPLRARARSGLAAVAADLALLVRHPVYLWTVAGQTVYAAVLGAFAFYGPKAGRDVFGIAPETADIAFGAITVLTGAWAGCGLCSPCRRCSLAGGLAGLPALAQLP